VRKSLGNMAKGSCSFALLIDTAPKTDNGNEPLADLDPADVVALVPTELGSDSSRVKVFIIDDKEVIKFPLEIFMSKTYRRTANGVRIGGHLFRYIDSFIVIGYDIDVLTGLEVPIPPVD